MTLSRSTTLAVVFLLIGGGVAAVQNQSASEQRRAIEVADKLLIAPAAAVPCVLENLQPIRHYANARLRDSMGNRRLEAVQRLHAAYALADSDEGARDFVLAAIPTAPAAECKNIITALEHAKKEAVAEVSRQWRKSTDTSSKVRYAIVALHLDDPEPARAQLAIKENPIERTAFIRAYAAWHGDLSVAARRLAASNDEAFRSGLCAALGTVDSTESGSAIDAIRKVYAEASDGGTHSAAGWALRQWGGNLPKIERSTAPVLDRHWFVNGKGIAMIEVPDGTFIMGTAGMPQFDDESPAHEVVLTRPYYLADREVTVEQFQRFVDDADYPASEKPRNWEGPSKDYSPTPDCPVQMVSWFDAILYCNWLSEREGRNKCYVRTGKKLMIKDYIGREEENDEWRCDFAADGYRLPTEAEWEFAARAGSSADYCFGAGTTTLADYDWFVNNADTRTWPGGRKLPNARGLFDMHGNVCEWCWDYEAAYSAEPIKDPHGPAMGKDRVLRGGAVTLGALACRSAYRGTHRPTFRSAGYGIRVCCGRKAAVD